MIVEDMAVPDKILTQVETADMAQLALIQAMRAMSDNVKMVQTSMHEMREEMKEERGVISEVKERLVRMEASLMTEEVKKLRQDVTAIQTTLSEQRGAYKLGEWIRNFGPFFMAMIGIAVVYFAQHG